LLGQYRDISTFYHYTIKARTFQHNFENREKLFDVNFTTKTKGMGLGLIVVKNVVEQAKGTIDFNSIEGEGTTFIVSFPLHK
jgi:nitrogen-specific signal transduction histidine kinase